MRDLDAGCRILPWVPDNRTELAVFHTDTHWPCGFRDDICGVCLCQASKVSSRASAGRGAICCAVAPNPARDPGPRVKRGSQTIRYPSATNAGSVSPSLTRSKVTRTGIPILMPLPSKPRSGACTRTPSSRSTVTSTYGSSALKPGLNA